MKVLALSKLAHVHIGEKMQVAGPANWRNSASETSLHRTEKVRHSRTFRETYELDAVRRHIRLWSEPSVAIGISRWLGSGCVAGGNPIVDVGGESQKS